MERTFVTLDLENLLAPSRRAGAVQDAIRGVVRAVRKLSSHGVLLGGVAVCDRDLQTDSAWALSDLGIRVHAPEVQGTNASDLSLIDRLRHELPQSATAVVIGSGDHIFAPSASALSADGLRVRLLARPGSVSHALYRAADDFTPLVIQPVLVAV